MHDLLLNQVSGTIIDSAFEIHKTLGPGLLENVYEECLFYELQKRNLKAEKQKSLPLIYKELNFEHAYRLDLLVEDKIVVELKCVEHVLPVHEAQLISYLKLAKLPLGLLINFKVPLLKQGIKRFKN